METDASGSGLLMAAFWLALFVGWGLLNPLTLLAAMLVNRRRCAWCAAAPLRRGVLLALVFTGLRAAYCALIAVEPVIFGYGWFLLLPDTLLGSFVLQCLSPAFARFFHNWSYSPHGDSLANPLMLCGPAVVLPLMLLLCVGAAFWAARLGKATGG